MSEKKLPKVLSISLSAWRSDSAIHTQTDLFKYYDPDRVAQIYTKSDMPDTPVCNSFFRISENEIIRSVYKRKPVGKRVENGSGASSVEQASIDEERARYAKAHKKKSWLMTLLRELVWSLGVWKTKALDEFIEQESPDVYFVPIYPVVYMGKLQLHVLKKHPRPYVCYLADDNYSYKPCGANILSRIHRFFLRGVVRKLAKGCTEMFTITETEAKETDRDFGTHSVVLTKGIDYEGRSFTPPSLGTPIRMVYTGNLLIGRASSLCEISRAMSKINADGERVSFDIYTPTQLDEKTTELLNSHGCHLRGSVPRSEVDRIQSEADIVVFAESLEKKHRYDARLSFSTKLTDYFKNGKCIFAIGDESIAPIIYLRNNDAAVCACEYSEIENALRTLTDDVKKISEYARKAYECGKRNHDSKNVADTFVSAFVRANEKGNKE